MFSAEIGTFLIGLKCVISLPILSLLFNGLIVVDATHSPADMFASKGVGNFFCGKASKCKLKKAKT